MFTNRPNSDETEDDLLAFQRDFLASGSKPATTVIKKRKSDEVPVAIHTNDKDIVKIDDDELEELNKKPKIQSPFERNDEKDVTYAEKSTSSTTCENANKEDEDMETQMDEHDTHITAVLSKIEERNMDQMPITFPTFRTSAFPSVFLRADKNVDSANKNTNEFSPRKSIFARQFKNKSLRDYGMDDRKKNNEAVIVEACPLKPLPEAISINKLKELYPKSRIVSGDGLSQKPSQFSSNECQKIHDENIEKISTMSETEILAEKDKLIHELNPTLVKFLQNRSVSKHITKEENFLKDLAKQVVEDTSVDREDEISSGDQQMDTENDGNMDEFTTKEKFVNMDIVETEKLAWMEMIPEKHRNKPKISSRFDFDGNILDDNINIPSHIGLHHHGDEPDLPGYNLQELFILSRSNFTQQRVFAMTLVGKILAKAKAGEYVKDTSEPVLKNLLESGILFLLRWSLDEQSETLLQASVSALHSLLCPSNHTEELSELKFLSNRGCETMKLNPNVGIKQDDTDYEIAEKDVIAGLIKMKILQRIRYILEVCRPSPVTINHCLDILIRICKHSIKSSVEIFECPRLVSFIIKFLIPVVKGDIDSGDKPGNSFKYPFPKAIRLLRMLCIAGRHLTSRLLNDHKDVQALIVRYVANDQDENYSETEQEVLKLWIVCCSYGFLCDLFSELFQIIVLQIQSCTTMLSSCNKNGDSEFNERSLKKCGLILKLCSVVFSSTKIENTSQCEEIGQQNEVIMSIATDIFQSNQLSNSVSLLLITTDFLTSYLEMQSNDSKYSSVNLASYSERLSDNVLPSIYKCIQLLKFENLVGDQISEKIPSLPEIDVGLTNSEDLMKFQLLSSYLQCCVTICRINKNCCQAPVFQSTITHIVENYQWMLSSDGCGSNYYMKARIYCLYWSVNLYQLVVTNYGKNFTQHGHFFYIAAFRCFTQLGSGDEHLMHCLLSYVIFHPDLIRNALNPTTVLTQSMASMDVSKSLSAIASDPDSTISLAVSSLSSIRSTYISSLYVDPKILSESRDRIHKKVDNIATFLLRSDENESSVPADWSFIPLLQIYDQSISRGELLGGSLTHISNSLLYLCLLEYSCEECLASVSVTAKIVRLMCVFLAGNDIFLTSNVKKCLMFLFSHYCDLKSLQLLDFSCPIPGISSFYDFYISLLEQYEGVSYGDELFSAVVLLPLHQLNNGINDIKKALWSDRRDILRILSLPISKLLIPVSWYLYPVENDVFMIRSYVSALAQGYCSALRCPVPYLMAIHHTAQFLFNDEVDVSLESRKEIYHGVMKIKQDEIRKHILLYISPKDGITGFQFSSEMAVDRKRTIAFLSV
ncbi:RNA polymerase II-associated protein 1-like isoform X1 [Styela clava]